MNVVTLYAGENTRFNDELWVSALNNTLDRVRALSVEEQFSAPNYLITRPLHSFSLVLPNSVMMSMVVDIGALLSIPLIFFPRCESV